MPTLRTASVLVSGSMTRPPSITMSYCWANRKEAQNRQARHKRNLRMKSSKGTHDSRAKKNHVVTASQGVRRERFLLWQVFSRACEDHTLAVLGADEASAPTQSNHVH